jgi:hypothetical protein
MDKTIEARISTLLDRIETEELCLADMEDIQRRIAYLQTFEKKDPQ